MSGSTDMDPYLFSDTDDNDYQDGNTMSGGGGSGDGTEGDSAHLVAKLEESALSGAMFERKSAARNLLEAFRQTCFTEETITSVIAVIEKLVEDPEQSVRTEVMEQLPHIALFCHEEGPYLDYVVPQHILPHIVKLLTDKFTQVRKTSQAGLLLLVERGIVAPSQVEEHVCPVILEYTSTRAHEDYRTEISQFMAKLAPLVGKEITIKTYLERFCNLCHDSLFQVRRVCASSMGDIASVVGINLTEKVLLRHFQALCMDEIWGVRKGCAEVFTVVSSNCRLPAKKGILTQMFVSLLQDPSRWVRVAACQTLGPFITTFLTDDSPPSTPEASEAENKFLEEYQIQNQLNDSSNDKLCEPNLSSVISTCPLVASSKGSFVTQQIDEDISDKVDENINLLTNDAENLDHQNPSTSSEPMEIDDEIVTKTDKNNLNSRNQAESEKSSIEIESSCLSSNSMMLKNPDAAASSSSQQNPSLSISSRGSETVFHYHAESEKSNFEHNSVTKVPAFESGDNNFNTWQYWRLPIPDIELDIVMVDGKPTPNVHVRAKVQLPVSNNKTLLCSSELNVNVKLKENDENKRTDNSLQNMELEINSTSSSFSNLPSDSEKSSAMLDSTLSRTTVSISEGRVSQTGVHRSYLNLYSATRDQGFEDAGFESLKLGDTCYDDDSDEQLSTSYPFGDEYSGHDVWAAKTSRPRLLADLPKSSVNFQDIVPEALLDHFTGMCQPCKDNHTVDTELVSFCVYNLPAVVLTLGPQNWSLIRDCYEALACNMQWKIRYTLAASLHEIANILGPELSERDLVPFYNATVKDLDEVRVGILRNLANFIKMLGSEARRKCLESLNRFACTENSRNWRFRLELAEQIQKLSEMYEAEEIYKHLCPVSMDLMLDRVAEVRKKALSVVPYLVTRLNYSCLNGNSGDQNLVREFLLHLVKTLGHSEQWVRRQAFAALSGQLVEMGAMSPSQFAQDILPHLINLSEDRVPNVRLVVAQSLAYSIVHLDYFTDPSNPHKDILHSTLLNLQEDEDRDVRFFSQPQDDEDI